MKNKVIRNIKLYPKNTKKKAIALLLIGAITSTTLNTDKSLYDIALNRLY